ncbi:MAG: type III-D CRISPR-associated protein Csx19 [Candidatus Zhuqueibacterota bacterium]
MKANGLEYKEIKSRSVSPVEIKNTLEDTVSSLINESAFYVAWLDYAVLIGRWDDNQFSSHNNESLNIQFLQKVRIFNKDKELYLWRTNGGLKGRLRIDNDVNIQQEAEIIIANQVLCGTDARKLTKDDFTEINEERGTNLILPFNYSALKVDNEKNRVCIKTHNYIGYNEAHQASYVDCRFVGFVNNQKPLD